MGKRLNTRRKCDFLGTPKEHDLQMVDLVDVTCLSGGQLVGRFDPHGKY